MKLYAYTVWADIARRTQLRLSIAFDGSTPLLATLPVVAAAEEAGLDGVWSAEHVGLNDGIVPSALYVAKTQRLDVGVVGPNTDTRHPGLLAMELNSLAELGPGRIRVQVGTGDPGLARMIGADNRFKPLRRVEDMVEALRELLAGERVSMDSPSFQLDSMSIRPREQPPSIDVMAIRPKMLQLAAKVGDGVALSVGASRCYLDRVVAETEKHLASYGRDRSQFRITALALGAIDSQVDRARKLAAKVMSLTPVAMTEVLADGAVGIPTQEQIDRAIADGGLSEAADLWSEEAVDELALVSDENSLSQALAEYANTGIDELGVLLTGNPENHVETVQMLAAARQSIGVG